MNYRAILSTHRSAIMGLMVLIIILHHAEWVSPSQLYNKFITRRGSIGVDAFVFLSGFGLAFAIKKAKRFRKYYSRRLSRILPAYYVFELLNLLIASILLLINIPNKLMQPIESWLVPIGVWVNYDSHKWYISGALGFYIIAAFMYQLLKNSRYIYLTSFFFIALTTCFIPTIAHMDNMPLAIERLPALAIGLTVGVMSIRKEDKYKKTLLDLIAITGLFIVGVLLFKFKGTISKGFLSQLTNESHVYLWQSLIAPFLCILVAYSIELLNKIHLKFIGKFLSWFGCLSLELYLIHTLISGILELIPMQKAIQILLTVVISCPAAIGLKWLADKLRNISIVIIKKLSIY